MIEYPKELDEPLADLAGFLLTLGPYRECAVVVGGMVPVIYRHLESTSSVGQAPLTTFDLDIAVPERLETRDETSLQALIDHSGFQEKLRGSFHPPVSVYQHVRHGEELGPVYVELLAPLTGSTATRDGVTKTVVEVQEGVEAQVIRYLDLLLERPLAVDFLRIPSFGVDVEGTVFRVPHPAMYVLQKVLCRETRRVAKRDKDLAYIFDVLTLYRYGWGEMGDITRAVAADSDKYTRWITKARLELSSLFRSPTADGPVAVHRVYSGAVGSSAPAEETVYRIVSRFLVESGFSTDI